MTKSQPCKNLGKEREDQGQMMQRRLELGRCLGTRRENAEKREEIRGTGEREEMNHPKGLHKETGFY